MNILELTIASLIFISASAAASSSIYHTTKAELALRESKLTSTAIRSIRANLISGKLDTKEVKEIINTNLEPRTLDQLDCTQISEPQAQSLSLHNCKASFTNLAGDSAKKTTREFKIWTH